jgi:hypothetical protein
MYLLLHELPTRPCLVVLSCLPTCGLKPELVSARRTAAVWPRHGMQMRSVHTVLHTSHSYSRKRPCGFHEDSMRATYSVQLAQRAPPRRCCGIVGAKVKSNLKLHLSPEVDQQNAIMNRRLSATLALAASLLYKTEQETFPSTLNRAGSPGCTQKVQDRTAWTYARMHVSTHVHSLLWLLSAAIESR